jgi:hypothetical protein
MWRSTVLSLPLQYEFPGLRFAFKALKPLMFRVWPYWNKLGYALKNLSGTNIEAHFGPPSMVKEKSFITLTPGRTATFTKKISLNE